MTEKPAAGRKHGSTFVRAAIWCTAVACVTVTWLCYTNYDNIGKVNVVFSTYFGLRDSLNHLERVASDSLLELSGIRAARGVMIGWDQAAQWLEKFREYGRKSGISVEYKVDSLQHVTPGNDQIFKLPIRLHLSPEDGEFETVMRFMQAVCADSIPAINFDGIEIIGNGRGVSEANVRLMGWIRP